YFKNRVAWRMELYDFSNQIIACYFCTVPYILPQSVNVRKLLELMLENAADDFPKDTVKMLLKQLLQNVDTMSSSSQTTEK
ncbi:MAG: hypothetical protein FWF66_03750, partial [Candidatus Bathyarchaeota archaeon]|nr:hypothetical protein [Candidatus Termiticorpusculum sp.]